MLPTQRKSALQNRIDAFLKDLFKVVFKPPYRDDLAYLYKASIVITLTFIASVIAALRLGPVFLSIAAIISYGLALALIHGPGQDNRKSMYAGVFVLVVMIAALVIVGVLWSPILLAISFAFAVTQAAEWFRRRNEGIPVDEKRPIDGNGRLSPPKGTASNATRSNRKIHDIAKRIFVFTFFAPAVILITFSIGYTLENHYLIGLSLMAGTVIFIRYQIHSKPWRDPKYQFNNTLISLITIAICVILFILTMSIPAILLIFRFLLH